MVPLPAFWVKVALETLPENTTSPALVMVSPKIGLGLVAAAPTLPVKVTVPVPAVIVSEFVREATNELSSSSSVFSKVTEPPAEEIVMRFPDDGRKRTGWTNRTDCPPELMFCVR